LYSIITIGGAIMSLVALVIMLKGLFNED
jgi:hypothetical protein